MKDRSYFIEFRIHKLVEFYLCVSLESLATFVLSIPEGVVEHRTAVHPVRAFTSIGRDCVGCFVDTWKGDCLGSSSRGQPRGPLPLHQVTQQQFIKFTDPTRRSGHNNLLHVLPRRVHITTVPHAESSLLHWVEASILLLSNPKDRGQKATQGGPDAGTTSSPECLSTYNCPGWPSAWSEP
jgi:hypothetical protein